MLGYFRKIRWIFYFSFVGSLASLLISSFIAKPVYESSVILVPSLEDINQMQSQAILFYQLTRGGMSSPAQIFIDIANSYNFKREFIEKFNLLEVFGEKDIDGAVKLMDSKFQIEPLPSGSFALKVRDVDKNRTKDLAKKYVLFLNEKANWTLNAKGRELRRFLERRIKEIEDSMKILGG
jgi:Chain length determinant protein.